MRATPIALTVLLAVGLVAPTVPASAASSAASAATSAQRRPVAPSYENPLKLELANGKSAASCADPDVLRSGTKWYLYCTTDALDEGERDANGELVFHSIPIFESTNLIDWSYVGDAFNEKPAWIPATGFIWAPEVIERDGTFYLYYAAPETVAGGTAIGVATSDSPIGPWVDSGDPVVDPRSDRWQYDPEVIEANGKSYLYFGSYFGGIFARDLSSDLTESVPATETRIAVDNRYEGTVIVEHNGWYYFMGSATNCCAGPLTGYSVFAARSRSPLGPFVDRDGVSLLAGRVGGTPVLTQNGNRWVGPGHNTVFTDFDGQDWTIYHAVDRTDPYYSGEVGYTKRPALLDPLDWHHGWPEVRGGYGPSDSWMPGPAAQPRERTAYRDRHIRDLRVGRQYRDLSENFSDATLGEQWEWVRPEAADYSIANGKLTWATQNADLHPPAEPLASILSEDAPAGNFVVETALSTTVPAEGCCQNYVQGGVIIYGDEGNYVKLSVASIWNTRQVEFGKNVTGVAAGYPTYGNGVVGPVGDVTYLRIAKVGNKYTAFSSLDRKHWVRGGTWTHDLGSSPKIGLVSMGGAGFESTFDYVEVSRVK